MEGTQLRDSIKNIFKGFLNNSTNNKIGVSKNNSLYWIDPKFEKISENHALVTSDTIFNIDTIASLPVDSNKIHEMRYDEEHNTLYLIYHTNYITVTKYTRTELQELYDGTDIDEMFMDKFMIGTYDEGYGEIYDIPDITPTLIDIPDPVKGISLFNCILDESDNIKLSTLKSIDFSNFDYSELLTVNHLISPWGPYVSYINLSNFNAPYITDMSNMFTSGIYLTTLILDNFNTSNVTDMNYMFTDCYMLTSLDLSSFDTRNVIDMSYMFTSCINLTTLDLSGWDLSHITDIGYIDTMFNECTSLETIYMYGCNQHTIDIITEVKPEQTTIVTYDLTGNTRLSTTVEEIDYNSYTVYVQYYEEERTNPKTGEIWWANTDDYEVVPGNMTIEEKVGQLFIVRPDITSSLTTFTTDFQNIIDTYHPAGILLGGQNITSKTQLTTLINSYKAYDPLMPLIISDEEGGRVARIAKSGILPSSETSFGYENALAVGQSGNVDNAIHMGDVIGSYLAELGINGDYAPVADVFSNPVNTVIGNRAFGTDAQTVTTMVGGFLDGFNPHNVINCLKHFPGHGDTSTDTHTSAALVTKTWDQLMQCEIIPYIDNMDKADMIMVAHIIAESIDPGVPASISHKIVTEKLREELGYQGIITTDGMEMAAVSNGRTPGEAALAAIQAGCDMICCPAEYNGSLRNGFINAYTTVLNAVKNNTLSEEQIDKSVVRILKAKMKAYK